MNLEKINLNLVNKIQKNKILKINSINFKILLKILQYYLIKNYFQNTVNSVVIPSNYSFLTNVKRTDMATNLTVKIL